MLEIAIIKPESLGALIGKRVYSHTNNDATPDSTNDYTYTYDAVGNVLAIYNANSTGRGNELYYFTQDAFGNELTTSPFSGTVWSTARAAGITEHQTGKWIDPFTGLYYFHARFYDSGVGRFVGRDRYYPAESYGFNFQNPTYYVDNDGNWSLIDPKWKECLEESSLLYNCIEKVTRGDNCLNGACGTEAAVDCDNANKCAIHKGAKMTYCEFYIAEVGFGIIDIPYFGPVNLCVHSYCKVRCPRCPFPIKFHLF